MTTSATAQDVHLLVLTHGMWGHPRHLAELERIIRETKQEKTDLQNRNVRLDVLVIQTNSEEHTYDGFDWGGERVAEEIYSRIDKLKTAGERVAKISFTGYSMGGLVARYVIGILHQRNFFDTVEPVNFNTIATPHIGIPQYPGLFSKLSSTLGSRLLSRTGEQFYVQDQWSPQGRPLLEVMADPERIFYQALKRFPHVTIYANAINDRAVPYLSGAIEAEDPFIRWEEDGIVPEYDPKYRPVITGWHLPDVPKANPAILSSTWIKNIANARPPGPPALQFGFPGNLLVFAVAPVVLPTILTLATVRLSISARSSRARVKLLEKDESYAQKLVHAVSALESEIEAAVLDIAEGPNLLSLSTPIGSPKKNTSNSNDAISKNRQIQGNSGPQRKGVPVLTDSQLRMVGWLNQLPNLRKKLVFISSSIWGHAIIVSRDPKGYPEHKEGEGVIRCWADAFVL